MMAWRDESGWAHSPVDIIAIDLGRECCACHGPWIEGRRDCVLRGFGA